MPLSCNLGTLTSWHPLGHSRPVTGLLYLHHYLSIAFTDILIKPSLICKAANRLLPCLLTQNVPHSSYLVLFLNGVAIFFQSVVAVAPSAVPFTSKAVQFIVSTLQHSQNCYNLYVSTHIPPVFFVAYFLQQNLKVRLRFFHVNCMSHSDRRELISLWSNTTSNLTLEKPPLSRGVFKLQFFH